MKKTTLIIIGISAVVLLFVVWLYLLIYGTPTKVTEYFTDFSLFGGGAPAITAPVVTNTCLLYTSPSPRDRTRSRMPSSA